MTKFLTAAAWSALVITGAAVAETPPAETTEVTEEAATETASEMKTIRYGDKMETETESEADTAGTVASVTVDGEVAVEGDDLEEDSDEESAPDAE